MAFDGHVEPSVSDFYYTGMRPALVVGLCAMGGLLVAFRGRVAAHRLLSVAAGTCLLILALCPIGRPSLDGTFPDVIHLAAGAVFSLIAIAMVGGLDGATGRSGQARCRAVRRVRALACVVMSLCLVLAAADLLLGLTPDDSTLLFWLETIGLSTFGIAWLVSTERSTHLGAVDATAAP